MTASKSTPPLFAISGSHAYQRDREIRRLIQEHSEKGWRVETLDGSNLEALVTALSPSSFFSDEQNLIVVTKPDKADLELLTSHYESDEQDIIVLLSFEGDPKDNTPFGKFLKKLGKSHKNYPAPKEWEMEEIAADFCISEARQRNKTLPVELARAIVVMDGSDMGFLSFEIFKIATLADVDGVETITAEHIRGALAPLAEMAIVPVVDAIAQRNPRKIILTMERLKKNSKNDPTMAVSSFLANAAVNWLCVADLKEKNVSYDEAAAILQVNPWFYKNKIVPQAAKWNRADLILLLAVIGDTKRAVLSGEINPWVVLSSRLLELCR